MRKHGAEVLAIPNGWRVNGWRVNGNKVVRTSCVSMKPKYQTARTAEGGEDTMRKHGAEVPNAEQAFGEKCERQHEAEVPNCTNGRRW